MHMSSQVKGRAGNNTMPLSGCALPLLPPLLLCPLPLTLTIGEEPKSERRIDLLIAQLGKSMHQDLTDGKRSHTAGLHQFIEEA